IVERGKSECEVMVDYLVNSGLAGDRRVAVVDVGWHGSQQRAIHELLRLGGHQSRSIGLYLGAFSFAAHLYASELPHFRYFFNRGQPREYQDLILSSLEIVELFFPATEGSLVNMERALSGEFTPVTQAVDAIDHARNEIVKNLQDGVERFAEDYFCLKQN